MPIAVYDVASPMGSPSTVSLQPGIDGCVHPAGVVIEADHVDDIVERAARRPHHVLEPVVAEARLRHVVGGCDHRAAIVGGDDAAGEEIVALAAGGRNRQPLHPAEAGRRHPLLLARARMGDHAHRATSRPGSWPAHHAERGPRPGRARRTPRGRRRRRPPWCAGSLWKVITSSTSSMPAPAASTARRERGAKAFRACAAASPASVTRPSSGDARLALRGTRDHRP